MPVSLCERERERRVCVCVLEEDGEPQGEDLVGECNMRGIFFFVNHTTKAMVPENRYQELGFIFSFFFS